MADSGDDAEIRASADRAGQAIADLIALATRRIDRTYSVEEVNAIFRPDGPDWWLRDGVRTRRFPCLKIGHTVRFTEAHIAQITATLEQPPVQSVAAPVDVSVLGATARSVKRHRNRRS